MARVTVSIDREKIKGIDLKLKEQLFELMAGISNTAKRLAPVDTGRLRASIHLEPNKPADTMKVSDGVNYGSHQEFGTVYNRPQPFMRPALAIEWAKFKAKHLNRTKAL